jgi:branched-chain amino acid transport system permease protein
MSLMFPGFFGGEGGVTTNRVYGGGFLGLTFGTQLQVYYLIAVYCFVSTVLMFAFTKTPLGRMLNAVRDNPERVEFIGYSTQRVRYLGFMIAGFFAGIGGALAAINFEIVNASDSLSAARSGGYLFFTFLGGATFFFGPMIGAVLLVLASVLLSEVTKAWILYLGLIFLFMVMYAPGGIASLIMMNVRVRRAQEAAPALGLVRGTHADGAGAVRRRRGADRARLPPAARVGVGLDPALPRPDAGQPVDRELARRARGRRRRRGDVRGGAAPLRREWGRVQARSRRR